MHVAPRRYQGKVWGPLNENGVPTNMQAHDPHPK